MVNDLLNIRRKIYTIRGLQVMLDADLAHLYDVETKILNRAVKRNKDRFPDNFCFQLDMNEYRSQFVADKPLRFQSGTSNQQRGGRRYLPYAFTEQGVAISDLKAKKAGYYLKK